MRENKSKFDKISESKALQQPEWIEERLERTTVRSVVLLYERNESLHERMEALVMKMEVNDERHRSLTRESI
jgi:hypothetical protein